MDIFEFDDYKAYLTVVERQRAIVQKGFRSRMAEELGCQNAYISQVLNGDSHFSLEQGFKVADFLNLGNPQRQYFLTMIETARAGTSALKKYFQSHLAGQREKNLDLKGHMPGARTITPEAQAMYYSHWTYAAIHILTTLKDYRDIDAIVKALRIPTEAAQNAVMFLINNGLLEEKRGELHPGTTEIHLSRESPLIRQHHTNWRLAAIESLAQIERSDIHYSTVATISEADAAKLKARLVKVIEEFIATVKESSEQTMYGFNLDFFSLIKN